MFINKQSVSGLVLLGLSLALSGCATSQSSNPTPAGSPGNKPEVQAAFYPLEFLVTQIGGDLVNVTSLAAAGAEPHDMELTPVQVAQIEQASLVVYLEGFMPAVDAAITAQASMKVLNLVSSASLLTATDTGEGAYDPHVWLDPANMISMATAVRDRLVEIDPTNHDAYTTNAATLIAKFEALDAEFTTGLANCQQKTLVTAHEAFGYLANAYGFAQLGITGLSPESEPSPARLVQISKLVVAQGITTIYYETLVSPEIAETIAAQTGATTAVLDPIEGLAAGSADTFISVMQANLLTLRKGQNCS
jgi:zinc transport system substrate-binding protein